jgi:ribosome-binding factor A
MAKKQSFSKLKYQEKILHEINALLRKDFADPRLVQVSVTSVELSSDYSVAKVYWDTFNSESRGDCKKAIDGIAGKMRTKLAALLKVRHTPQLQFIYDSQFEDEKKIMDLIKDGKE